jgi:hypothetical protein
MPSLNPSFFFFTTPDPNSTDPLNPSLSSLRIPDPNSTGTTPPDSVPIDPAPTDNGNDPDKGNGSPNGSANGPGPDNGPDPDPGPTSNGPGGGPTGAGQHNEQCVGFVEREFSMLVKRAMTRS